MLTVFCAGLSLLVLAALVLSGSLPFLPPSLKLAVSNISHNAIANSAAAAYWGTQIPSYAGYPSPLSCSINSAQCYPAVRTMALSATDLSLGGVATAYIDQNNNASSIGTPLVIGQAGPVELDWSCQPSQHVTQTVYTGQYECGCQDTCGSWPDTYCCPVYCPSYTTNSYDYNFCSASSGTNFDTGGAIVGSTTVNVSGTSGSATNYNLVCSGTGGSWTLNVPVQIVSTPTATIDAGAGNGVPVMAYVGVPYSVTASYVSYAGDSLTATAINGSDQVTSVPCSNVSPSNSSCWTQPDATKTYTVTPTTTGNYTFYASEKTTAYPSYNNYASVSMSVFNQCPNGQGPAGSCTSCNSNYVYQGGSCFLACTNGAGINGSCTACNSGYVFRGGYCFVPCPFGGGPGTYAYNGGSCVILAPTSISTFFASPSRIRKGIPTNVTFSWNVNNTPASCTISGPAGFTPLTINPVDGLLGTTVTSVTLSQTATFTLTCGSITAQTSINFIPEFKEI